MAANTKQLIANTLVQLSEQKSLKKITVEEIIEESHIARQTFYNHFRDKNDLIFWIYVSPFESYRDKIDEIGFWDFLLTVCTIVYSEHDFLKQASKLDGQNSLKNSIRELTYKIYYNYIRSHYPEEFADEAMQCALQFTGAGEYELYYEWMLSDNPRSPEEQTKMMIHCMPEAVKKYLPLTDEQRLV